MNNNTIELIDKIKHLRKTQWLSQAELAKKCNVPQSTIGRIENHSMNPSLDLVINILGALDVNLKEAIDIKG